MNPPLLEVGCDIELAADDACSTSELPMLLCAVSAGLWAPVILSSWEGSAQVVLSR